MEGIAMNMWTKTVGAGLVLGVLASVGLAAAPSGAATATTPTLTVTNAVNGRITDAPDGCVDVRLDLNDPNKTPNWASQYARAWTGDTGSSVMMNSTDGLTYTACLPVSSLSNGTVKVAADITDGSKVLASTTTSVALDLETSVVLTPLEWQYYFGLGGHVRNAGPDTTFHVTLDGKPIAADLNMNSDGYDYAQMPVVEFAVSRYDAFRTPQTLTGDHVMTVSMTSRGVTTNYGSFVVNADPYGKFVLATSSTTTTGMTLSGVAQNFGPRTGYDHYLGTYTYTDGSVDAWYTVTVNGVQKAHDYLPTATNGWWDTRPANSFELKLPVAPTATTPIVVTLAGDDFGHHMACTTLTIVGSNVTSQPCTTGDSDPAAGPSTTLQQPVALSNIKVTATSASAATITFAKQQGLFTVKQYKAVVSGTTGTPWTRTFTSNGATPQINLAGLPSKNFSVMLTTESTAGTALGGYVGVFQSLATVKVASPTIAKGKSATLSVQPKGKHTGQNVKVAVQFQPTGSKAWTNVTTVNGKVNQTSTITVKPTKSGTYRVTLGAHDDTLAGTFTTKVTVK
jgi:hypothetical protein